MPGWLGAAARRACACVRGQSAGCEDLAQAWMRSPQKGSHRMIAAAQRTGRPRIHRVRELQDGGADRPRPAASIYTWT